MSDGLDGTMSRNLLSALSRHICDIGMALEKLALKWLLYYEKKVHNVKNLGLFLALTLHHGTWYNV